MYSNNDFRLYLEHSWGKKPEQKAAEREYNAKYYQEHKSKWGVKDSGSSITRGGSNDKEPTQLWYDKIGAITSNPAEGVRPVTDKDQKSAYEKLVEQEYHQIVNNKDIRETGKKIINKLGSMVLHTPVNIVRSTPTNSNRPLARKKTYGEGGSGVKKGEVYRESSYDKNNRPVARKKTYGNTQGSVVKTEVYREKSYDENNRPKSRKRTYGNTQGSVRKTSVYRR